ncbi:MAG: sugar ABC transporter permease [Oscillospiraceae bacterium]|jgi:arabinogalactan oligomer/maltooligosaccharide transport system permease protein|nr:sugar ABC transporter permease [Oscillospiraceae bacterium]
MKSQGFYRFRKTAANVLCHVFLGVLSAVWLIPIAWLILNSLREERGAYTSYVIPKGFTLQNYVNLFTNTKTYNFPQWFLNTFIVAVLSCLITTLIVLMVSFVFSRLRFPSRRKLMNILLVLGMFPGFMSMVAVYHILKLMNLTQTLTGLVIVYSAGAALVYYIAKGFFDTIPRSVDEAATIDGASKNTIFWRITLPMSRPIVVYTLLTSFMAPWADFIFVSVLMKGKVDKFTVALGLRQMLERETVSEYFTQFCAGSVLVSVPLVILFLLTQKNYVEGITGGSTKG